MEIIVTNANSGNGDSVFPGDSVIKNPPANAGEMGLTPDLGRSHMPRSNYPMCPKPRSHNC